MGDSPALSVILATPDSFQTIRRTVAHLRAQTVPERIEVVIVAPSREGLRLDDTALAGFHGHQVVEKPEMDSVGAANAAGVRAAKAPVVALGEDHSFPEPEWAEALLRAHKEDYAAVGPVMKNANPATLVSWADLFVAYSPWLAPGVSGERDHLPGHNSSYKKRRLLDYGERLEEMMAAESVLHWDLRRQGRRLYLQSGAKTAHTNFSLLSSWLPSKFQSGRVFGWSRARDWPGWKRLLYAVASPLIPLVRLRQIAQSARACGQGWGRILKVIPVMMTGLVSSAIGEAAGYAAGAGGAVEKLAAYEYHRTRHLSKADSA